MLLWSFSVKVTPNAKKEIIEVVSDLFGFSHLTVKVRVLPEDGKANKAVIEALSDYFSIAKSCISIQKGHTQRNKIVEIKGDELKIKQAQELVNNKKAS